MERDKGIRREVTKGMGKRLRRMEIGGVQDSRGIEGRGTWGLVVRKGREIDQEELREGGEGTGRSEGIRKKVGEGNKD